MCSFKFVYSRRASSDNEDLFLHIVCHETYKLLIADLAVAVHIGLLNHLIVVGFVEKAEEVLVSLEDAFKFLFADMARFVLVEKVEGLEQHWFLQIAGRLEHGRFELAELDIAVAIGV
jgi:hypothetical protein